ncbi:hypothetical protein VF09_06715 [Nostoc linckia z9]|nr:hypothetical protein VF09_06715 [Nostoc linckia z9]
MQASESHGEDWHPDRDAGAERSGSRGDAVARLHLWLCPARACAPAPPGLKAAMARASELRARHARPEVRQGGRRRDDLLARRREGDPASADAGGGGVAFYVIASAVKQSRSHAYGARPPLDCFAALAMTDD